MLCDPWMPPQPPATYLTVPPVITELPFSSRPATMVTVRVVSSEAPEKPLSDTTPRACPTNPPSNSAAPFPRYVMVKSNEDFIGGLLRTPHSLPSSRHQPSPHQWPLTPPKNNGL